MIHTTQRQVSKKLYLQVLIRDKFRDRVTGKPVFFPGAHKLRCLIEGLPYHRNDWTAANGRSHPDRALVGDPDHWVAYENGGETTVDNLVIERST